jgi:hypothetical protein
MATAEIGDQQTTFQRRLARIIRLQQRVKLWVPFRG